VGTARAAPLPHPHMGPPESSVARGLALVVVLVGRGGARSHA
jgi:hypothetical protein